MAAGSTTYDPSSDPGYGTPGYQQALEAYKNLQYQSKVNDPIKAAKDLSNYGDIFRQHFNDYAGRDPSKDEYSRFFQEVVAPQGAYPGGQFPGVQELAQRADNLIRNNLAGEIQKGNDTANETKAKGMTGDVNQLFQSMLGRDATGDEASHFSKLLASGAGDTYTLSQALQQLPEYQNKQNATQRDALRGELSAADQTYFQQNLMPAIQSQFAQSGRVVNSDSAALASAFANAGTQQNTAREQYLAQLGASDYANTRQNTINQYLSQQQRNWQTQDQTTGRNYQLADQSYGRSNDITDYQRQQAAYQDYLNRMGRRQSGGIGGIVGTAIGTGAGAYFGGSTGALAGSQIGGKFGGIFDSY
jgi:hypothetical protein